MRLGRWPDHLRRTNRHRPRLALWGALGLCLACLLVSPARPAPVQAAGSSMTLAFYDGTSTDWSELMAHIGRFTDLAPTGIYLSADSTLRVDGDQQSLVSLVHSKRVRVFPVVQNYRDGQFRSEDLKWLASSGARRALTAEMLRTVVLVDADGINLDFEEVPESLRGAYVDFVRELSARFHSAGKKVLLDVPVNHPAFDAPALASASDWLVLMAYDEHNLPGRPGAIAGYRWVKEALNRFTREVPPEHVILGLGGYGYDWEGSKVEPLSFREALKRAGSPDVIKWDNTSRAPWFTYSGADGRLHTVWFSDVASLQPLLRAAQETRIAGTSLWRLGLEDPGLWSLVGRPSGRGGLDQVPVDIRVSASRTGQGEVAQASETEQVGRREVSLDPDTGEVTQERYLKLPQPLQIRSVSPRKGTVALTFDDGPDPRWTPRILDILKAYGTHATFFVIGSQAIQHPELVARIQAEGNEVANHSYTHAPGLELAAEWRFSLELSATQRVIEAATGHSATLFRYPYMTSLTEPNDGAQDVIDRPARHGYRLVGHASDTFDWTRPGTPQIVYRVLTSPDSQVILLHDGGGDRSQTVAALPTILEGLRAQGLRSMSVSEAIGEPRQNAMPEASRPNRALGLLLLASGWLLANGGNLWLAVVKVVLVLVFARIVLLGFLGLLHSMFAGRRSGPAYRGPVTALIAAHNEEAVIGRTLQALLHSDYPKVEIIVVDDGSTDSTAAAVSAFADQGVRLIQQDQSGKAQALRRGFASATHPVVVALDADTLFTPSTISHLVQPFADGRVGAVAGNPKVGNRLNLLTWFQVVEYVLTLNLERRAYALLGCVPVVPGAVGAWRRDAVLEVGGFTGVTLAEDTDITLALGRRRYRVTYAPRAVAYTEAPQTLRGLSRQRSRWAFGMLQCLWKHRGATFSPRLGAFGLVALPGMWSVQLLLPLVAPTVDVALLLSPFLAWAPQILLATVLYNGALVLLGVWALAVDREPVALALLVPLQNLFYRQFLYVMALKAVVRAFRGARVGWNPVARLGTSTIGSGPSQSRR